MIALFSAVVIHAIIFLLINNQNWLSITPTHSVDSKKDIEVTLLTPTAKPTTTDTPETTNKQTEETENATSEQDSALSNNKTQSDPSFFQSSTQKTQTGSSDTLRKSGAISDSASNNGKSSGTVERNGISIPAGNRKGLESSLLEQEKDPLLKKKPELLDLSKISLSPDASEQETSKVFSKELQQKIADSKAAQKEYLKGKEKTTNYAITEDADGTRYVNIKGVCWRMPKEGSNDGWAIVFDGCGLKSKSFHFEFNISPSVLTNELLGPDSPFNLEQQPK